MSGNCLSTAAPGGPSGPGFGHSRDPGPFQTQTGISTAFESVGVGIPLPPDDQVQVMHIVQESLSNVRKHALATGVRVRVERAPRGR